MTEPQPRPYRVTFEHFEMMRHPQIERHVHYTEALSAADAVTQASVAETGNPIPGRNPRVIKVEPVAAPADALEVEVSVFQGGPIFITGVWGRIDIDSLAEIEKAVQDCELFDGGPGTYRLRPTQELIPPDGPGYAWGVDDDAVRFIGPQEEIDEPRWRCEGCGMWVDPDPETPDGRGHQVTNRDGSPGYCGPVSIYQATVALAIAGDIDAEMVAATDDAQPPRSGGELLRRWVAVGHPTLSRDLAQELEALSREIDAREDMEETAAYEAGREARESIRPRAPA